MSTHAVVVEYGGESVIVEVEIKLPTEVARMYLNEKMILAVLASGQAQTIYSRHTNGQARLTPISVIEPCQVRAAEPVRLAA